MAKTNPKQLKFDKVNGWGGKRRGSGRINRSGTVNHMKRSIVNLKLPLHITLKLKQKLPSIRRKSLLREFKVGIKMSRELGFYVIHFSIQSDHIHLFCETENNKALALGMRALAGRFAKIVRSYAWKQGSQRRGSIFKGRYHLHVLKTPREVKNALEYVLLNLSKHKKFIEYMDEFSSAPHFAQWKKLLGSRFKSLIQEDAEFWQKQSDQGTQALGPSDFLSPPRSWLAQVGWMRA